MKLSALSSLLGIVSTLACAETNDHRDRLKNLLANGCNTLTISAEPQKGIFITFTIRRPCFPQEEGYAFVAEGSWGDTSHSIWYGTALDKNGDLLWDNSLYSRLLNPVTGEYEKQDDQRAAKLLNDLIAEDSQADEWYCDDKSDDQK